MGISKIISKFSKPAVTVVEDAVTPEMKALQAQGKKLLEQSLSSIDDGGCLKSYALGAAEAMKNLDALSKKLH